MEPVGELAISEAPAGASPVSTSQPDGSASVRYIFCPEPDSMPPRYIPLPVALDVAAGSAVNVRGLSNLWVQWHSDDDVTATVQLQGRIVADGETNSVWTDIGSAVTAAGAPFTSLQEIPQNVTDLRANTTAYVSGTPKASVSGRTG